MSEEAPVDAPTPAKVDPETLVLRGKPAHVVRFRRGAIIAIAALGSSAIAGAAWMALEPVTFHAVTHEKDPDPAETKAPPDALAEAMLDFFGEGQSGQGGGAIEPAADDEGVLIDLDIESTGLELEQRGLA